MPYKLYAFPTTLLALLLLFSHSTRSLADDSKLAQQRVLYTKVKQSLEAGSTLAFEQHKQYLLDYPLYPYLEYARISRRLTLNDRPAVDQFLASYQDTWLAERLRNSWLALLYSKRLWQLYQHYYVQATATTELECHYHFARYQTGQRKEALDGGVELWAVGKSQPQACDALFSLLVADQRITQEVAWRRYTLAILNHQYALGSYVERFFVSDQYRRQASNYVSLDKNPARVGEYNLFAAKTPEFLAIIEHGIRHLAGQNALLALKHWARYLQSHPFEEDTRKRVLNDLVKGLYAQGHEDVAAEYLLEQSATADISLLEWQLRNSLYKADWGAIVKWIAVLPEEVQQQQRWRYWYARALLLHSSETNDIDAAKTIFRELSRFRSFYGLLASDAVANPYSMQHEPVPITETELATMAETPGIKRAREMLYLEQHYPARREWYHTGKKFDSRQWIIAARIAQQWHWHQQAILAMTRADYWDDIDVRFPLAFRDVFERNAKRQDLPLPLVLAVSRQESAFAADVTSPAGAIGLMQLMPATAKEVAHNYKVPFRGSQQLVDPELNIRLGSQYYKDMLKRFGGNRILATAAYNAGPHRVSQWLGKSAGKLPFDVWIEVIPFNETRQYVQNVLSFSVIYAHHLQRADPLITVQERGTLL